MSNNKDNIGNKELKGKDPYFLYKDQKDNEVIELLNTKTNNTQNNETYDFNANNHNLVNMNKQEIVIDSVENNVSYITNADKNDIIYKLKKPYMNFLFIPYLYTEKSPMQAFKKYMISLNSNEMSNINKIKKIKLINLDKEDISKCPEVKSYIRFFHFYYFLYQPQERSTFLKVYNGLNIYFYILLVSLIALNIYKFNNYFYANLNTIGTFFFKKYLIYLLIAKRDFHKEFGNYEIELIEEYFKNGTEKNALTNKFYYY